MDVVSACRLPVASVVWQPNPTSWVFTVVAKATFLLSPGESPLAPDQEPVTQDDERWNNEPTRSLRAASDLAPRKPRADVLLVGSAYAPNRQPARSVVARLVVGEMQKAIEVYCDRAWSQEGALLEGQRFARMPLWYERAAGGPETSNPVGIRPGARDTYGKSAVPNLQPPGVVVASPDDVIKTVGFGPIAAEWPSRRELLGRHAGSVEARPWLRGAIAEIDPAFFNAAPRDQQLPGLRDGERIVLENLHPDLPSLATNLALTRVRAVVEGRATGPAPLPLTPDTLFIHTDRAICTLTFRGQLALSHPQERGRVLVSQGEDLSRSVSRPGPPPQAETMIPGISAGFGAALPFGQSSSPAPARAEDPGSQRGMGLPFARSPAQPIGESAVFRAPMMEMPAPVAAPPPAAFAPVAAPPPAAFAPVSAPPPAFAPPPMVRPQPVVAPVAEPPLTMGQLAARAPEPSQPDLRAAALAGAGAVSNAAAARDLRAIPAPEPSSARPVPASARPTPRAEPPRDVMELVWYDVESVPRMRRKAAWRDILDALEQQPLDPDLDDPALAAEPMEIEERREVFEILSRGEPTEAAGLEDALFAGVRENGKFVAQLVLAAGELVFPFDELETLRATVTTVTPLVAGDENLKGTLEAARDFLKTPDLLAAPAVAEGLTTRVKDAFAGGKRVVPQGYLEAQTERALLDQRHYQRRSIFKARRIRALLQPAGNGGPIPLYLPEEIASTLPLYQRFPARVIAEVHVKADQYETQTIALKAIALLRTAPLPVRK